MDPHTHASGKVQTRTEGGPPTFSTPGAPALRWVLRYVAGRVDGRLSAGGVEDVRINPGLRVEVR